MRIGLVIYGTLDTISGGFLYDRKLVDFLRQQGDTVEIVSLPWESYGRCFRHNFSNTIYDQLRGLDVDILLQDELNHPSLFRLNKKLRPQVGYPIISIVHHLRSSELSESLSQWFYKQIERAYLQTLDGCIYNSHTTCKEVEALADPAQYIVAYPGGDRFGLQFHEMQIRQRAQESGPLRLLFVGNLIPRKGLHILIDALTKVSKADWRLTVVGDPAVHTDYTASIHNLIQQSQLENHITLLGKVPDDQLLLQFQHHHVLTMPSSYEGFGIAYLEGMAFGLPTIAMRSGALPELVTHNENGFLIDMQHDAIYPELAGYIQTLAQNRNLLTRMSLSAWEHYQQHPDWDDSMANIRHFLTQLI